MIVTKNFFNKVIVVLITVLLFLITPERCSYELICVITIIDIGVCLWGIYKQGCLKMENALFWFWTVTVLFSLGQNLAYLFIIDPSLVKTELLVGYKYSVSEMCKGSIFTIQALNMMTLGLFWPMKREDVDYWKIKYTDTTEKSTAYAAYYIGTVLLIISIIPQIMFIRAELIQFFTMGYGETIVGQFSGIVLRLHYLFIPSLFIRYTGKVFLNKKKNLEIFIILFQIMIFLAMGDRGSGLALFVTFIWLRAATDLDFNIKKYIIPILIAVLSVPIIKYYRIGYAINPNAAFSSAVEYVLKNNPIIDILLEMGGSQNIIIMTMNKTAMTGIAYGKAYLDFFIKMLPGFMGIEQNYGTLAKWVIGTTGYQTQGYSIWGEAYLNFGRMGILFMFVIGYIFRYFLKSGGRSKVLSLLRVSITLSFFCDIARRSISEFGYNFLYDIVVPIILVYCVGNYLRKRKERNE